MINKQILALICIFLLLLTGCSQSTTTKSDEFFFVQWGFVDNSDKYVMNVTLDLKKVPKDMRVLESIQLLDVPRDVVDRIDIVKYSDVHTLESWDKQQKFTLPLTIKEGKEYTILIESKDELIKSTSGIEFNFKDTSYTFNFNEE